MSELSPYGMIGSPNPINPMFLPRTTVRQAAGEKGVRAMPMGPNSQEIFMDSEGPLVWFVATDENANKVTVSGFTIAPYVPEPEPDLKAIMARMEKLEEMIANGQSNAGFNAANQQKQQFSSNPTNRRNESK